MKLLHSSNCDIGRKGFKPEAIVIHITEGTLKGDLAWVHDPKSKASYHYIVGTDLETYEIVNPENTAWHAGLVVESTWKLLKKGINPNLYTIGIAVSGMVELRVPFKQQIELVKIIAEIAKVYHIPLDAEHVIAHNRIRTNKTCPGDSINLAALIHFAKLA
jgi:N-acetylmuramoyl-L-alanine amidase